MNSLVKRKRPLFASASGSFIKLMLFYFILVSTSLTPSPFVAGNEYFFAIYCLVALTYALFLACFWREFENDRKPEDSPVTATQIQDSKPDFPLAGTAMAVARDFLLFFASMALALGAIQLAHTSLGHAAPLPLTDAFVASGVAAACLLGAVLANARLGSAS